MKQTYLLLGTAAALSALLFNMPSMAATSEAPFTIQATVIADIELSQVTPLNFGITVATGEAVTKTIAATSSEAGIMRAIGDADTNVTASIENNRATMDCTDANSCGDDSISVTDFTFAGDITGTGDSGTGRFNDTGNMSDIRIGATEHITASDRPGLYQGTATLNMTYS